MPPTLLTPINLTLSRQHQAMGKAGAFPRGDGAASGGNRSSLERFQDKCNRLSGSETRQNMDLDCRIGGAFAEWISGRPFLCLKLRLKTGVGVLLA